MHDQILVFYFRHMDYFEKNYVFLDMFWYAQEKYTIISRLSKKSDFQIKTWNLRNFYLDKILFKHTKIFVSIKISVLIRADKLRFPVLESVLIQANSILSFIKWTKMNLIIQSTEKFLIMKVWDHSKEFICTYKSFWK